VELLFLVCFEVLALDASIAGLAERIIEFVIMTFAVWMIVDDVEFSSLEGISTCFAYET
jgi:hypothetical protein